MEPPTTFFTFYTAGAYGKVADRLGACCKALGLPFMKVERPDRGTWKRNVIQKPQALLEAYEEVKGPVVCLDADCIIHKMPTLFTEPRVEDVLVWRYWEGQDMPTRAYVGSGVTYWNRTRGAHRLLKAWAESANKHLERGDFADRHLKRAFLQERGRFKPGWLPSEYFALYNRNFKPEEVVISCNERMTEHQDGLYARKRVRLWNGTMPTMESGATG